jgi:tetratricopeptide (TPR) repeat protein
LACLALYFSRKEKTLLFSYIWIAAGLLPVMNLVPFLHRTLWSERYMYLSVMGFSLGISFISMKIYRSDHGAVKKAASLFGIMALLIYTVVVYARERQWKDEKTLYLNDLKASPESFSLNALVAEAYTSENNPGKAISYYEKILRLEPTSKFKTNYLPYLNLTRLYVLTNQNEKAVETGMAGIKLLPLKVPELFANVAVAQYNLGRINDAIKSNEEALSLKEVPGIQLNLGLCYFKDKDYRKARQVLEKIRGLGYPYTELYRTLYTIYIREHKKEEAALMQENISALEQRKERFDGMLLFWGELI